LQQSGDQDGKFGEQGQWSVVNGQWYGTGCGPALAEPVAHPEHKLKLGLQRAGKLKLELQRRRAGERPVRRL
jgi:hypothetical protein